MQSFEVKENLKDFVNLQQKDISNDLASKKKMENKAIGLDKLHSKLLKNYWEAFVVPIILIFQASLTDSELPIQFRSANVYKKGDQRAMDNYRQLSLTAVLCKIMEDIVREKVENYFHENNTVKFE